jgi:hypothetical protein
VNHEKVRCATGRVSSIFRLLRFFVLAVRLLTNSWVDWFSVESGKVWMKGSTGWKSAVNVMMLGVTALGLKAQLPTGTINGRVTDSGSAVVTGAQVVAVNQSTNVSRETVTNADGLYVFPDLTPGPYSVVFKASGFM